MGLIRVKGRRSQVAQHRVLQREVVAEVGQDLVDVSGQGEVGKLRQAGLHGEDVGRKGERDVSEKLRVTWDTIRVLRLCRGFRGRGCRSGPDGFLGFGWRWIGGLKKRSRCENVMNGEGIFKGNKEVKIQQL